MAGLNCLGTLGSCVATGIPIIVNILWTFDPQVDFVPGYKFPKVAGGALLHESQSRFYETQTQAWIPVQARTPCNPLY